MQAQCRLMTLPTEVQQAIVNGLDLPEVLFVPAYPHKEDAPGMGDSHLEKQHETYYGPDRQRNDDPGALALLTWSRICSFYRRLLGARLCRDLVLRTRADSIQSLEALCRTPLWDAVESLTICNTVPKADEIGELPSPDSGSDGDDGGGTSQVEAGDGMRDTLRLFPGLGLSQLSSLIGKPYHQTSRLSLLTSPGPSSMWLMAIISTSGPTGTLEDSYIPF